MPSNTLISLLLRSLPLLSLLYCYCYCYCLPLESRRSSCITSLEARVHGTRNEVCHGICRDS